MAIQNYLTNYPPLPTEADAYHSGGVRKSYIQSTIAVLSTDSATSTYAIVKNLPSDAVFADLLIETDALTSGTSYSVGLYDSVTGLAVAATCFAAAISLVTASTRLLPLDGMVALTHDNTLQPLWQLAGQTAYNKKAAFDLVLTANTPSTVAGNVTFRGTIVPAG